MSSAVEIFNEAERWVYSEDTIHKYNCPSREVYEYLRGIMGNIMGIINIAHKCEYPITSDLSGRLNTAWYGEEDIIPLRPEYTPKALADRNMSEDEYMWLFMERYILPLYTDPKRNVNYNYVRTMKDVLSPHVMDPLKERWQRYLSSQPETDVIQWGTSDIIAMTPVNDIIARARFGAIRTLVDETLAEGEGYVLEEGEGYTRGVFIIHDNYIDVISVTIDDVFNEEIDIGEAAKVAVSLAPTGVNPDTSSLDVDDAIMIFIIYEILEADDLLINSVDELIANRVSEGKLGSVGELMAIGYPVLEKTRRAYEGRQAQN